METFVCRTSNRICEFGGLVAQIEMSRNTSRIASAKVSLEDASRLVSEACAENGEIISEVLPVDVTRGCHLMGAAAYDVELKNA